MVAPARDDENDPDGMPTLGDAIGAGPNDAAVDWLATRCGCAPGALVRRDDFEIGTYARHPDGTLDLGRVERWITCRRYTIAASSLNAEKEPAGSGRLTIVPAFRDEAAAFVDAHHRHHGRPHGYLFGAAVATEDGRVVGVITVARPSSRRLQDGWTVEVNRSATDGTRNANSALYGAAWRAAKALGYRRAVTYTQAGESGASLRAAGWLPIAELAPRTGWDTPSRRRSDRGTSGVARTRWEITASPPPWPHRPTTRTAQRIHHGSRRHPTVPPGRRTGT
ncbi:XF1762 family protein [Amycolatopsis sp. WGS_07]|uniref:XF1762 family protein n=1 Tax=Amycolatopsis sp. WGS_07 TaxID=3076764 RepID=UPI003873C432